jgi:hypothetical protein
MCRLGAPGSRQQARRPLAPQRRWALLGLLVVLGLERRSSAEGTAVPPELQVELLSKLSLHDRSFPARAGDVARVVIVVKSGSTRSDNSATVFRGALGQLARFGGLPHVESVVAYQSASALAKRCRDERVALVYVTPGLENELDRLRAAMIGVDVLTVAAVPEYVESGIVLGFELLSGRPKMLINYEQAKRQNVDFAADVLKLMKVVSG